MSRHLRLVIALGAVIALALPHFNCSRYESSNGTNTGSSAVASAAGTVRFISLEGGFYGIVTDSGQKYDPTNLSADFRTDNLRVRFQYRISDSQINIHM